MADDASGIQAIRTVKARDTEGREVNLLVGHTQAGEVAVGVAADGVPIALLDAAGQAQFQREYTAAMRRAAEGTL